MTVLPQELHINKVFIAIANKLPFSLHFAYYKYVAVIFLNLYTIDKITNQIFLFLFYLNTRFYHVCLFHSWMHDEYVKHSSCESDKKTPEYGRHNWTEYAQDMSWQFTTYMKVICDLSLDRQVQSFYFPHFPSQTEVIT
jgi:hypothetical protein